MNKKLNDKYITKMEKCFDIGDTEIAHGEADDVLCTLLLELGYDELVDKFCKLDKWYS